MAMSATQLAAVFKNVGKMMYMAQLAEPDAYAFRKAMMGCVDQTHRGDASEFDLFNDIEVPLATQIKGIVRTLQGVPAQIRSTIQSYLQRCVAVDLGLQAGATMEQIGTALVATMNANGQTVASAGINWANEDGFAVYFAKEFNIVLPQSDPPNIPDEWIDDDVIP